MTKIPTEAIKLAAQGGWKRERGAFTGVLIDSESGLYRIGFNLNGGHVLLIKWQEVALDREFWVCLGKALGWPTGLGGQIIIVGGKSGWMVNARTFYDLILRGQDPTEYWQNILSAKDN